MKFISLPVSTLLHHLRYFMVMFICAVIFCFNTLPAAAITSYQSEPTEGTTQLLETQRKTDEAAKAPPLTLREAQEKTRGGLNEVQGTADIEKMKRPENSQTATSVEQEVKGFLEKMTGNK
ncbi:MAG TPA: hypothetical protein VK184_06335 [Nostocaceae cyanobacterium]|nr:hypothetical protein [Nostocaceae cyanobacterium]